MNYFEQLNKINHQLDKAREFRYFALFGSFILFLDVVLAYNNKLSLLSLTYEQIKLGIKPGDFLLFICSYTFYLSFIVPILMFTVRLIFLMGWVYDLVDKLRPHPQDRVKEKDVLTLTELKRFALLNDNRVALETYNKEQMNTTNNETLNFYCFSLLVSFLVNMIMSFSNKNMLGEYVYKLLMEDDPSTVLALTSVLLTFLAFSCFYFGVIRGCGIASYRESRIYLRDHGIN